MTPPRRTITLRYMTEFACVGSACEETCCGGTWRIDVDRAHFVSLQRLLPREEIASGFVELEPDKRSDAAVAVIRKGSEGACTFLADGWCSIHKRFGEDALPDVCAQYPRRVSLAGNRVELTAGVSCPEVARKLLLVGNAVEIVPIDPAKVGRSDIAQLTPPSEAANGWAAVLDLVRGTMYGALHQPYPIASRLFFIAFFADRLGEFLEQKTPKVDNDRLALEMLRAEAKELLDELHARRLGADLPGGMAFSVIIRVLATRLKHVCSPVFRRLFTDAMSSFTGEGLSGEGDERAVDPAALAAAWPARRAREAVFGPRLDLYLRNYAANWVMRDWFVWAPTLTTHVQRFLVRVATVRFLLLTHPGVDEAAAITDEVKKRERLDQIAVEVFYSFARAMEHSEEIVDEATDALLKDLPPLTAAAYLLAV